MPLNNFYDPKLVTSFLHEYHDRGMMKWNGFYLSDHTTKINRLKKQQQEIESRKHSIQMSQAEIYQVINKAIVKQLRVIVELNTRDLDNHLSEKIVGPINGYYRDRLLIDDKLVSLEDIFAIHIN